MRQAFGSPAAHPDRAFVRPTSDLIRAACRLHNRAGAAALKLLAGDEDRVRLMAAAAVVINFPARDDTWQGLVRALRDREDMVIAAAMHALEALATHRARTVEWERVGADLSRLAPLLVGRDGGHILLAYVKALRAEDRTLAPDLLVALSGQDHGYDAPRWRQWIASLPEGR